MFFFAAVECSTKKEDAFNFYPARQNASNTVEQNSKFEGNIEEQRRRAREGQLKKIESKIGRKKSSKTAPGCLLAQKKFATQQKTRIQLKDLGRPVSDFFICPILTLLSMYNTLEQII